LIDSSPVQPGQFETAKQAKLQQKATPSWHQGVQQLPQHQLGAISQRHHRIPCRISFHGCKAIKKLILAALAALHHLERPPQSLSGVLHLLCMVSMYLQWSINRSTYLFRRLSLNVGHQGPSKRHQPGVPDSNC
jgi:hypothetical protein